MNCQPTRGRLCAAYATASESRLPRRDGQIYAALGQSVRDHIAGTFPAQGPKLARAQEVAEPEHARQS
eukprot:3019996-Pyramimonas_sp.AAC.1